MSMSDSRPGTSRQSSRPASGLDADVLSGSNLNTTVREDGTIQVLFVDDSAAVREAASGYLRAAGYSVTVASDGFEALAHVVQFSPDVVLADTTMPRLDGYQMCALIKGNSDYRHIPVIMISSREGSIDQARATLVGSDAHISRPLTAQSLTTAVREVDHPQQGG